MHLLIPPLNINYSCYRLIVYVVLPVVFQNKLIDCSVHLDNGK